jgi:hypothetical protein
MGNCASVNYDTDNSIQKANVIQKTDNECFFVITCVFNPCSYQKRYDLYKNFANHMKDNGAQLITIECIFPKLNQKEFQVTQTDNPYHIQLTSDSIYWMKENLINIAASRLPEHAKWICWLDADIYFHNSNWVSRTIDALDKYSVVQMFETCNFLGPNKEILRTDYSFGYSVVHNKPIDQKKYSEWYPHPGYGWAMSKYAFQSIKGLPDYDIVGSGDLHFAFSLINKVGNAVEKDLHDEYKSYITNHSQNTYETLKYVANIKHKQIIGYVPVNISHYWHGSRKDRQYVDRWKILIHHKFKYDDIRRTVTGLYIIDNEILQNDILTYFSKRNEDTNVCEIQDNLLESAKKVQISVIKIKAPKITPVIKSLSTVPTLKPKIPKAAAITKPSASSSIIPKTAQITKPVKKLATAHVTKVQIPKKIQPSTINRSKIPVDKKKYINDGTLPNNTIEVLQTEYLFDYTAQINQIPDYHDHISTYVDNSVDNYASDHLPSYDCDDGHYRDDNHDGICDTHNDNHGQPTHHDHPTYDNHYNNDVYCTSSY